MDEFYPCNDKHDEVKREYIFRNNDYDPPYKESRETYYCKRPKGHGGDHKQIVKQPLGKDEGIVFWWRNEAPKTLGQQYINPPTRPDPSKKEEAKGFIARLLTKNENRSSR